MGTDPVGTISLAPSIVNVDWPVLLSVPGVLFLSLCSLWVPLIIMSFEVQEAFAQKGLISAQLLTFFKNINIAMLHIKNILFINFKLINTNLIILFANLYLNNKFTFSCFFLNSFFFFLLYFFHFNYVSWRSLHISSKGSFSLSLFFFFFGPSACQILVPHQGLNPCPWK